VRSCIARIVSPVKLEVKDVKLALKTEIGRRVVVDVFLGGVDRIAEGVMKHKYAILVDYGTYSAEEEEVTSAMSSVFHGCQITCHYNKGRPYLT
jgi:hypothetical protein